MIHFRPETPMAYRSILAPLLVWLGTITVPVLAAPLGEQDVIRLSAATDPDVAVARAEADALAAREADAKVYPNPSLGWEREHFPGGEGTREDAFVLSAPIELSGRRSARAALARSEANAASARAARSQSAATLRALETFYAALEADARAEVERRVASRLRNFAHVVGRRQDEGTASGHDLVRLELEFELATSDVRRAEAEAEAQRTDLMLLLSLPAPPSELRGELAIASSERASRIDRATRPSLELERASAREANGARESAGSAWVPAVSVQGGVKVLEARSTEYGYVAGVAVDLPLFSTGGEVRAAARAEERLARARLRAAERSARTNAVRAERRLARAVNELERFEKATRDRTERLRRAAEATYREGVRSLTELLDAERALAAIELRKLELIADARRWELRLREARGEFE